MATVPPPEALAPDPSRLQLFTLVSGGHPGPQSGGEQRASLDEVARWGVRRQLLRHAFRYRNARVVTKDLAYMYNPLKTAAFLRLLARGNCWLEDDSGTNRPVTSAYLVKSALEFTVNQARTARTLHELERELASLEATISKRPRHNVPGSGPPLYLRTDLLFDVEAGGAVAHIGGVVNNLTFRGQRPVMATTAPIPLVDSALEVHSIAPASRPPIAEDLWRLRFNFDARGKVKDLLGDGRPAFVYERANAYSYIGACVACDLAVPFVLEYNGSDAWISRNWGSRPLRREAMLAMIEKLNLQAATLVVVVSDVLAGQLVEQGVPPGRVLVSPNGVDTSRFHPGVDGSGVRAKLGIRPCEVVVGFVGSFGAWHGAEVLARAFALLAPRKDLDVRLLMVGEGSRLAAVRSVVEQAGLSGQAILMGLVPQEKAPAYMAACDILVAPHVPNSDGSAFFGSPTKLFEYLAMAKAVVASDLDQLGQVVKDGTNGLLVPPGDEGALAEAIVLLVLDPELRARLGAQARRDAVERHTWAQHTSRITSRLEELFAP